MPDSFSETTHTGYVKKILNSLTGLLVGPILFLVAFGVLYWGEGRVNVAKIADEARQVKTIESANEGVFVSTTGVLTAGSLLGDGLYLLDGAYASLRRYVEVYEWTEIANSQSTDNVGGSTDTTTTYDYTKEWSSTLIDSDSFKYPEGHANPKSMAVESDQFTANNLKVGVFNIVGNNLQLPALRSLVLNADTVTPGVESNLQAGKYVYKPVFDSGSYAEPSVGDLRISYEVLPVGGEYTLFGQQNGSNIEPYIKDNAKVFRLFNSTPEEAVVQWQSEYKAMGWMVRIIGFVLMWLGMVMFLNPLVTLLNVLPVLGRIGTGVVWMFSAVMSLILSTITVVISLLLHSWIAILVSLVIAVVVIGIYLKRLKAKDTVTI